MGVIKKCDICGVTYEPYGFRKDPSNPNGFSFLNIGNCSCGEKPPAIVLKPTDTCVVCRDKIELFIAELKNPPEEIPPETDGEEDGEPVDPDKGEEEIA